MRENPPRAFSLVEVVMALGIFAFAICSIMGLMTMSLAADRRSASDTCLAAMSREVFSSLRGLPFSSLPASTNFYFDVEGSLLSGTDGAYYACETVLGDATPGSLTAGKLKKVRLTFTWPRDVPRPETNVFLGSLANYE